MRLKNLHIKNFRKITEITINFPSGLTVLVGENNAGKTTIIDALRILLFSGRDLDALRLSEEDFRLASLYAPIEISGTFCDLDTIDETRFIECLIKADGDKYDMRLNLRAEFNTATARVNVKLWGGETETGSIPAKFYDYISSIYLQPLRDPEAGLKPGKNSQIARLIRSLTPKADEARFEEIAKTANAKLKELDSIKKSQAAINTQLETMAGAELAQTADLIFNDPVFTQIVGNIQPKINGLSFSLNGLGYNNLIFTATTLSTLKRTDQFSFRSMLIEEPEAHLHPQLQILLLNYLANEAKLNAVPQIQVITSSHSPILASQAPIDSIIAIHQDNGVTKATSLYELPIEPIQKKKLQRFLDATRAELFFAKKILMVEGVAEALLLPVFAKKLGGDLGKSAVTIVNVAGLNFDAFLPLFGATGLQVPVAIITDGDADKIGDDASATAKRLASAHGIGTTKVYLSERTFEHELARTPTMLGKMLTAFESLHPRVAQTLIQEVSTRAAKDDKADHFYKEAFKDRPTSKGCFAQELSILLESTEIKRADLPNYIIDALIHLGVIAANES